MGHQHNLSPGVKCVKHKNKTKQSKYIFTQIFPKGQNFTYKISPFCLPSPLLLHSLFQKKIISHSPKVYESCHHTILTSKNKISKMDREIRELLWSSSEMAWHVDRCRFHVPQAPFNRCYLRIFSFHSSMGWGLFILFYFIFLTHNNQLFCKII